MTDIRAIETSYKGYRFRSRLEARWAVFFDHLGIKWEYEPQRYVLRDGSPYLPDFRLSYHLCDIWVEVKGSRDGVDWERLWVASESHPLLILGPIPEIQFSGLIVHPLLETRFPPEVDPEFSALSKWDYRQTYWVQPVKPWLSKFGIERCLTGLPNGFNAFNPDSREPEFSCHVRDHTPWDAYAAARRARFEHGEHG